ncbi:hypothetical protein RUM44_008415 [Polyplax serrata]|uniref:Uncharacterized protein n=1 Tax=Polyplax serrata TaxID=468196 RepID=A0ABR1BC79_POLSC
MSQSDQADGDSHKKQARETQKIVKCLGKEKDLLLIYLILPGLVVSGMCTQVSEPTQEWTKRRKKMKKGNEAISGDLSGDYGPIGSLMVQVPGTGEVLTFSWRWSKFHMSGSDKFQLEVFSFARTAKRKGKVVGVRYSTVEGTGTGTSPHSRPKRVTALPTGAPESEYSLAQGRSPGGFGHRTRGT